jgi:hypothetical protein
MLAVLSLAFAAGAACGLARLKVWAILPVSTIFLLIVVILGSYLGLTWGRIALIVFAVLMLLQVSYIMVGAVLSEVPTGQRVSDREPARRSCFALCERQLPKNYGPTLNHRSAPYRRTCAPSWVNWTHAKN